MTDRQAQYRAAKAKAREAKRAAGLAPLEVWAKPSDHAAIRAFVEDRHPEPEEAGEWACSECVARWDTTSPLPPPPENTP